MYWVSSVVKPFCVSLHGLRTTEQTFGWLPIFWGVRLRSCFAIAKFKGFTTTGRSVSAACGPHVCSIQLLETFSLDTSLQHHLSPLLLFILVLLPCNFCVFLLYGHCDGMDGILSYAALSAHLTVSSQCYIIPSSCACSSRPMCFSIIVMSFVSAVNWMIGQPV